MKFHDVSSDGLLQEVYSSCQDSQWSFVVTPNVNHLVRLSRDENNLLASYCRADLRVCDSQILSWIARFKGLDLQTNPGSDLVRNIFTDDRFIAITIAVVGPTREEFDRLQALYPSHELVFVPAGNPLIEGSEEWGNLLTYLEELDFGIALVGVSFPRQELLCDALAQRGIARGVGICCGAAVDFLTGKQKRAPLVVQRLSLEWLFRIVTQPRRLLSRYVVDAYYFSAILWRGSIFSRGHDN